jgi:hypothetical protein
LDSIWQNKEVTWFDDHCFALENSLSWLVQKAFFSLFWKVLLIDKETKQSVQLKEKLFNWVSNLKTYSSKGQSFQLTPEEENLKSIGYIQ